MPDFATTAQSLTMAIKHYLNGSEAGAALDSFTMQQSDYIETVNLVNEDGDQLVNEDGDNLVADVLTSGRYFVHQKSYSLQGLSHQFEFSRDSDSFSYLGSFSKRLLGFGYVADKSRSIQ